MQTKKKVLVVEDSRTALALIKNKLEELGFEVLTAENGKDGINKAKDHGPDIALIDTLLPDTDGFEVCRQIRLFLNSEKTKIIIMTGSVDAIDAVKARQMGADDYVVKTMDMMLMETTIKGLA